MHLRLTLKQCRAVSMYLSVQMSSATAQLGSTAAAFNNSFNLGDVLARSASDGQAISFTLLNIWNSPRTPSG